MRSDTMTLVALGTALLLAAPVPVLAEGGSLPAEQTTGSIEPVFAFTDAMPTGVTVSAKGRIFVNFPRWGDDIPATVAEIRNGKLVAFPDAATNRFDAARPAATLSSVQSVVVDPADRLWILDTASPSFGPPIAGAAKMMAVDLATGRIVKTIVFPPDVALATSYVNDMRFDLRHGKAGIAYLTDSSLNGPGGIIVVDLDSGSSRRLLSGHGSTGVDPSFVPVVEGDVMLVRPAGGPPSPFRVAADGIALSADGANLYYSPLSSRHLYSVPTALLRDPAVSPDALAAAVVDLGEKGASDGLESDARGRIYITDYEHNAIRRRDADGSWTTVAHDPRLLWPDTLSIAQDGYLYVTANQVHRQPNFNRGIDKRVKPYSLFRLRIDAGPVLLK